MTKSKQILYVCALIMTMTSCGAATMQTAGTVGTTERAGRDTYSKYLPKAVVYRTNGDYIDNVPVVLSADRTQIISYPAPSDITAASSPLAMSGGWLLDRRGGIGARTAFLRYTYSEYAALPQTPSQIQLLEAIIPGACVTEYAILPITVNQASKSPETVDRYVESLINR